MDSELVKVLRDLIEAADACAWSANTSVMDDAIAKARETLAAHDAREGERGEYKWQDAEGDLGSSRHAAQPQPSVADWVMVPRKITPEMEDAADRRDDDEPASGWGKIRPASRQAIWDAMLAAAPQPQEKP